MTRVAKLERKTKETDIKLMMDFDSKKNIINVDTGIGFFNHVITSFAKHSGIDIDLQCKGDLEVDYHHTIEDVGIAMGECFNNALGDKVGIARFASEYTPLDEALTRVVIDVSGRPFIHYDVSFVQPDDGSGVNPNLFEEFFRAFAMNAKITLHIDLIHGKNSHHIIESIFKSMAVATKKAIAIVGNDIPSTKGVL